MTAACARVACGRKFTALVMNTNSSVPSIANTPEPPYFAVIFTSMRAAGEDDSYGAMAARMNELAAQQPGFLGVESARGARGGIQHSASAWRGSNAITGSDVQWSNRREPRGSESQRYSADFTGRWRRIFLC